MFGSFGFCLFLVLFLLHIVLCFSTKHDVVVVLGSSDERILAERVSAAIQYIQSSENHIILFVSGGVKNAFVNANQITEAAKAAKILNDDIHSNNEFNVNVQIVLDEKATNTAENFAYLKQWVNQTFPQDDLPDFVITTSDFHQIRAEQIFQGIIPQVTPKWNLSKSSCIHCWSDESIHIKNVSADIMKARLILM
jgi:uncharacterized SAM-binding protein YcdF (DUF218 family)